MNPARLCSEFFLALALVPAAAAQDATVPLPARIGEALAGAAALGRRTEIGKSTTGKPIFAVEVAAKDGPLAVEKRPAVLVVAGLTGHHLAGTDAVLHHIKSLVTARGEPVTELLRSSAFYFVPQVNPDGATAFIESGRSVEPRGNLAPVDDDRDGRTDEDGGDDLNGDRLVTKMRVKDPEGDWIIDSEDPRVMRKADRAKGERGTHKLLIEGKDDDGDGEFNEDGPGGVDLDRNFPHGFTELDRGSGPFAVSEPESRALADYVLAHPNIALVLVYGLDDTLLALPRTDARSERVPPNGIMPADLTIYRELGESYKKLTSRSGKQGDRHDGSFWSWCYVDLGLPSFACSFWTVPSEPAGAASRGAETRTGTRPDSRPANPDSRRSAGEERAADPEDQDRTGAVSGTPAPGAPAPGSPPLGSPPPGAHGELPSGAVLIDPATAQALLQGAGAPPQGRAGGRQGRPPASGAERPQGQPGSDDATAKEERARLAWDDAHGANGFVKWTKVEVKGLGETEVGGWKPGALVTPPAGDLKTLLENHHRFLLELAGWLPRVTVADVKVEAKGGDVFDVTCIVANDGKLPLRTATGVRTNRPKRGRLVLTPNEASVLMGETRQRVDDLEVGKRQEFRWILRAPAGTKVKFAVFTNLGGEAEKTVELR